VYPDDILPNVEAMAPIVDDIELVLFESGDTANLPAADTIARLAEIGAAQGLSYTVHFPIDAAAGSRDVSQRYRFVDRVRRCIARCAALDPYGYILHLEGVDFATRQADVMTWRTAISEVCHHIADVEGVEVNRICVENLGYPAEWHLEVARRFGFSLCCDIGHLWNNPIANWERLSASYIEHSRVVHLHGVNNGRDHVSLAASDRSKLETVVRQLAGYEHVATLELFSAAELFESLDLIERIWESQHS
jgi:hypothetical protein